MSTIDMDLVDLDSWLHYEQGIWRRPFLRKSSAVYGGFGLRPSSSNRSKSVSVNDCESSFKDDIIRDVSHSQSSIRPVSSQTECRRMMQVLHPTNKSQRFIRVPTAKSQCTSPRSLTDQPLIPWVSSPCCVLSRSRERIHALLRKNHSPPNIPVPTVTIDDGSRSEEKNSKWTEIFENLLQQIDNLTLALEEEKLNHNDTKKQATRQLELSLAELNEIHNAAIRKLMNESEEKKKELESYYEAEKDLLKTQSDEMTKKLRRDIELLEAAFVTYREQLNFESNEKFNVRLKELEKETEKTLKKRLFELKVKMTTDQNIELAAITKHHEDQISRLRKDQKRHLKEVKSRFSESAADLEELKESRTRLQEIQEEMNKVTDLQRNTMLLLDKETMNSKELELKCLTLTSTLEERANQIDMKYRVNQDKLLQEIADLRMLYMKKCNEYENEKIELDTAIGQRIKSVKDAIKVVIETRNRTALSLTSPQIDSSLVSLSTQGKNRCIESHYRRSSCPGTRQEMIAAQIFAGSTNKL